MKHSKIEASSSSSAQLSEIKSRSQENFASKVIADNASRIAQRIELWVNAQPELTRILCDYVAQYAPRITEENPEKVVDLIVEKEIANGWEDSLAEVHLSEIEQVIVQDDRKDSALILYIQILQRGKVPVDKNPEQAVLLRSGLVKAESGYLKIANDLYKAAYSLENVEQMLPGITRPVKIIPSPDKHTPRASKSLALYSKVAIAACGLAVVVTSISSYIRESGGRAMATSSDADEPALVTDVPANASELTSDADFSPKAEVTPTERKLSERELFDRGEDHAINSRWVLMMRDFCAIPEASMYHSPAKKQVEQLFKLYSEDIQLAREIVQAEKGASCPM